MPLLLRTELLPLVPSLLSSGSPVDFLTLQTYFQLHKPPEMHFHPLELFQHLITLHFLHHENGSLQHPPILGAESRSWKQKKPNNLSLSFSLYHKLPFWVSPPPSSYPQSLPSQQLFFFFPSSPLTCLLNLFIALFIAQLQPPHLLTYSICLFPFV